jgi:alkylated DNA repair dioxygenase AlkB
MQPKISTRKYLSNAMDANIYFYMAGSSLNPVITCYLIFRPQPGYKYGTTFMKGRPLKELPLVNKIADKLKILCSVEKWNIGVNVVFYRDGKDRIGFHADDDQGESMILVVIPSSPQGSRTVVIQTKKKKKADFVDGDEQFELLLSAGDGYDMDGKFFPK